MLPDLSPANPFRPPHWRWDAARSLAQSGSPLPTKKDIWLSRAYAFAKAFDKTETQADQAQVAFRHEALYWAFRIWESERDDRQRLLRYELEARILADDTNERIMARCGIQENILEAYRNVFFDVKDRLNQPGYIIHQVIGPKAHAGVRETDYDTIWKLFGYCAGPVAVDMMVNSLFGVARPKDPEEVQNFLNVVARSALRRKAVIAAHTIRASDFTSIDIIEKFLKMMELESQASGQGAERSIEGSATAVLQALSKGFTAGMGCSTPADRLLEPYDQSAVELKYEEMIRAADGEEPDRSIIDIEFPDAPEDGNGDQSDQ